MTLTLPARPWANPVRTQRFENQFGIPLTGTLTDLSLTYGAQMQVDGGYVYDLTIDGPCVLKQPSASPVAGLFAATVVLMDSSGTKFYCQASCAAYLPATASVFAVGRLKGGPIRRYLAGPGPVLLKVFCSVTLPAGTATWGSSASNVADPAFAQATPVVLQ